MKRGVMNLNETALKALNFYPHYEDLLRQKAKTKTVRLGDQTSRYHRGARLRLTCGWNAENAVECGNVEVDEVRAAPIRSLRNDDLVGESPDCLTVAALPYVLSAIYRRIVTESDVVTIIGWSYLE
jgi:hypothetical protein